MNAGKIINLGLPKTGTTTLTRALRRASIKTADWKIRRRQTQDSSLHRVHLAVLLYEDYFAHGDPLRRLGEFQAFNELSHINFEQSLWPQTDWALLERIQTLYPGTRFLLNKRDPAKAANSIMRWQNLGTHRLPKGNVPGLPRGFGSEADIARWVDGHYRFCERIFAGAENFLSFEITDESAPQKIGAFLETDLPWWGRANARPTAKTAPSQPELTDS